MNIIYSELTVHKQLYQNFTHYIKEYALKLEKYEKIIKVRADLIQEQQLEIIKLKGLSNLSNNKFQIGNFQN